MSHSVSAFRGAALEAQPGRAKGADLAVADEPPCPRAEEPLGARRVVLLAPDVTVPPAESEVVAKASTAKRELPVFLAELCARLALQELHLQPARAEPWAPKAAAAAVPKESVRDAGRAWLDATEERDALALDPFSRVDGSAMLHLPTPADAVVRALRTGPALPPVPALPQFPRPAPLEALAQDVEFRLQEQVPVHSRQVQQASRPAALLPQPPRRHSRQSSSRMQLRGLRHAA